MNSSVFLFSMFRRSITGGVTVLYLNRFVAVLLGGNNQSMFSRAKKIGKQLRITKENPSRDDQQSSNHNKNPGIYHLTMETP